MKQITEFKAYKTIEKFNSKLFPLTTKVQNNPKPIQIDYNDNQTI